MPYRKNMSNTGVKSQSELSEDLEETPVYIKSARYGEIKHKISQPTFHFEPHLIKPNEITPGITRNEYELRRKKLFLKIPTDSCLILASNPESKFSSDGRYTYRQHSDFNFFTGLQESDCIAVFTKDAAGNCQFILFLQPIIKHEMCWHGHRCGLIAAIKYFGAHDSYEYFGTDKKLYEIMDMHGRVYFDIDVNEEISEDITREIKESKKKIRLLKPRKIMQQIRLVKSAAEVQLIRKSVEISSLSMIDCMQFCEADMLENELAVQFEHGCKMRGATRLSYQCSVASGLNAVNLNYFNNNSLLGYGDLCLIDCGCEYNGYSSDITRTFPINGVFSTEQTQLYEMVLHVSDQLIGMMKIGCSIKKLESAVCKLIKKGLKELGITCKMRNDQIKDLKISCADVHFVAHFIGLDIHDTSDITNGKLFDENMVLAIEPAIYLPDHPAIPPQYRGIGIRIEDDVLITKGEAEILSKALPRTVQQIESYMKGKSMFPRIRPFNLLQKDDIDNGSDNNKKNNGGDMGDLIQIKREGYGTCTEREIEAAVTLSAIRFESKKKEKIKQHHIAKQYNGIKLFQQAIYQSEQQQLHAHGKKRRKLSQSQSQKKIKTRNGNAIGTIPKLSNRQYSKHANTTPNSFYKSTKTKSSTCTTSKSQPQPQSKSIANRSHIHASINSITANHANSNRIHSTNTKFKKISNNDIICDDTDSSNSIVSSDTCNLSKSSQSTATVDISHLSITNNHHHHHHHKKKKKSLYLSPTQHNHQHHTNTSNHTQSPSQSRKRKRNEIDLTHPHTQSQHKTDRNRHTLHSSHRNDRYNKKEKDKEPPTKKSKVDRDSRERENCNHRYRYKYKYNTPTEYGYTYASHDPYYCDDYKYHSSSSTHSTSTTNSYKRTNRGNYYYNDLMYATPAFYAHTPVPQQYIITNTNTTTSSGNSKNTNANESNNNTYNTQSAYESFMAKSNDKNNT